MIRSALLLFVVIPAIAFSQALTKDDMVGGKITLDETGSIQHGVGGGLPPAKPICNSRDYGRVGCAGGAPGDCDIYQGSIAGVAFFGWNDLYSDNSKDYQCSHQTYTDGNGVSRTCAGGYKDWIEHGIPAPGCKLDKWLDLL
ncbi:MAG: hypothetical protein ACI87E_003140 [Mariniblastus sp.]|jgi:hypothetical protein